MSLYSQLLLLTNHSYALMAYYHLRFFYSSIIFFFPPIPEFTTPEISVQSSYLKSYFLCPFLWQIKSNKMQYTRLSKMFSFFSSFLSHYTSFLLFLSTSFLLLSSRMHNYYLICCLAVWLCNHVIPKLRSLKCIMFESIKNRFLFSEMLCSRKRSNFEVIHFVFDLDCTMFLQRNESNNLNDSHYLIYKINTYFRRVV